LSVETRPHNTGPSMAVLPPHISAYYLAAAASGVGFDEGTDDWSAGLRPQLSRDGNDQSESGVQWPFGNMT
jgi:hypothetical protein